MNQADTSPSWPRLYAADSAIRLAALFLAVATQYQRQPQLALAVLWLGDRVRGFAWRMLTAR